MWSSALGGAASASLLCPERRRHNIRRLCSEGDDYTCVLCSMSGRRFENNIWTALGLMEAVPRRLKEGSM